ncbi:hypothetical protein M565_ctg1P1290 [Vibrio cyclitrophicus FF75]|nr:hypothetical protein M565_ctg1P1290 [Vibrio cyclitrophicus FF75]
MSAFFVEKERKATSKTAPHCGVMALGVMTFSYLWRLRSTK